MKHRFIILMALVVVLGFGSEAGAQDIVSYGFTPFVHPNEMHSLLHAGPMGQIDLFFTATVVGFCVIVVTLISYLAVLTGDGKRNGQPTRLKTPQFSLQRLFVSVTLICVGIGLWFAVDRMSMPDEEFGFLVSSVLVGAGVGTIWPHPFLGGLVGGIVAGVACSFYLLISGMEF